MAAVQAGQRRNPDYNGLDQEGIGRTQATIAGGRRMSTAICYLQEAMRRTLNDSEFQKEFLKLVGDEVEPLLADELTKIVKNAPRDAETSWHSHLIAESR